MKKNQVVSNSPLLYIVQPKFGRTVSHMQKSFKSQNAAKEAAEEKQNDLRPIKVDHNIEQVLKDASKLKLFQEMAVKEKLTFLSTLPSHLSNVKCKVITENAEYEGIIQKYENEQVTLKDLNNNKQVKFSVEHISSISLIGF
jgi:Spore coat protein CotO